MFKQLKTQSDLKKLKKIAINIAEIAIIGDIFFLEGELGAGKTTFARLLINAIFKKNSLKQPKTIKSPSFPIMINYSLKNFEIFHYDLYRVRKKDELIELNINENLKKNITLIEWPRILFNNVKINNYFTVNLKIISDSTRDIDIFYTKK